MKKEQKKIPFMTAREAAEKWGISLRRVSKLCQDGRVPRAIKLTRIWLIPIDEKKPIDARYDKPRKRNSKDRSEGTTVGKV